MLPIYYEFNDLMTFSMDPHVKFGGAMLKFLEPRYTHSSTAAMQCCTHEHVQCTYVCTIQTNQAWASVCEVVESLDAKDELLSEERGFLLLFSNLGLQLLSPTEREKTANSIEVGRD